MGLLDFIFKSSEERKKEKRVKDVLKRTDKFIKETEDLLDKSIEYQTWVNGLISASVFRNI